MFCTGVAQPAQPFLAALLHHAFPNRLVVVVTEGLKAQESFQQDVETWLNSELLAPLFYPAWEVLPHEGKLPHADVISDRLQTLVALSSQFEISNLKSQIVVASVTALQQRTFASHELKRCTRKVGRGDRSDPLDLVEWLEEQGYEPEAQVTQKGEIASRGGILDVFPLTGHWPVRLEFFGDELESLREFDPLTQVSRGEIASVTLPPAGELGILRRDTENADHENPEASTQATLLDYLPRGTIFLLCESEQLAERAMEYAAQIPADDPFFIPWEEFLVELGRRGMTPLEVTESDAASPRTPVLFQGERESPPPRTKESGGDGLHGVAELGNAAEVSYTPPRKESQVENGAESETSVMSMFTSLDAFRPLGERAPDPQIADTQRREFFAQMHRWLRQGYAVHVFCNNDGERQRFEEIWNELGFGNESVAEAGKQSDANRQPPPATDHGLLIHLGTLSRGFICEEAKLVVVTDAEVFGRYRVQRPRRLKAAHAAATRSALDIDFTELGEGDLVVHVQYGIGRFLGLKNLPVTTGAAKSESRNPKSETECLVIEYAPANPGDEPPKLYVPVSEAHLVGKYVGAGKARPPLHTLGGTRWKKTKEQAERAVRDVAAELLALQAARETQPGHAFATDTPWQREFEAAFIFEETPDQDQAIAQTKTDMERARPMDRLICGDVGFGKTEVAIRAAFKAVMGGKQVAVLVPTTVLAQQHFNVFRERMADYPVRIELLSRFRTRRQQHRVVQDLATGAVDIVVGTHRLIQSDIVFKDLGLVVVDEEQRFGVLHKEKLKLLRTQVDVLTLSATPIPRTLYLALTGARDMSAIQTPPHDRLPVETIVAQYDERVIRDAIQRELNRGGQVFFLHNRVMTIEIMRLKLQTLVPQARIVVGHGQMHADDLEEVMTKFVNGEADVLLSTTIIESGLDIPNANTIIIDRADRFGLSDLYQLRGRVGRYKHQAYAYLLLPRHARLLTDVRKRISAIRQYSTLGSGFKVAMRDLEIRGAGNLLGAEQSGHITAVGFELYCQLLKQSVAALKGEKVKPRVEVSLRLDFLDLNPAAEPVSSQKSLASGQSPERKTTGYEPLTTNSVAALPHNYVPEPQHRIEIYRKLAQATDKAALETLGRELRDRFGPPPPPVELLLQVADVKLLASDRGVTVVEVQEDRLMLTRHGELVMLGGKFPRLTKKNAGPRLKEIARLLRVM